MLFMDMFLNNPVRNGAVSYDFNGAVIDSQLFFIDLIGWMVMKIPVDAGNCFNIGRYNPDVMGN